MKTRATRRNWIWITLALTLCSCARAPLKAPTEAMRPASTPELADDLPIDPLLSSIEAQIQFLQSNPGKYATMQFGSRAVSKEEYLAGLRRFVEIGRTSPDSAVFFSRVREEFEFLEVYGEKSWGDVFITSYYEPRIPGSLKPSEKFSQPLYRKPDDLITLDLALFDPKFASDRKMRGRLVGGSLVPYFAREQIDVQDVLKGKELEICWVDPIDAFFLQVQGSGTVELEDGSLMRLNYAEKNGQPYESIGKLLIGTIPREKMTLHTLETYLRTLPRDRMQAILNKNPSYVFFQELDVSAVTYLGVPATDGRTIATDPKFFPKGALAFLSADQPVFSDPLSTEPTEWKPLQRFVMDQDIGGAITGGGRLDLFWGKGASAKQHAGVMKQRGKLWYLVPKRK